MKIIEVNGNLFDTKDYTDQDVVFAHCIASDFGMFGGIATQFIDRFDMKNKLIEWADNYDKRFVIGNLYHLPFRPFIVGKAIKIDNVYNLITKSVTSIRPTKSVFVLSITDLHERMLENGDTVLAIPDMIGCGIDGLDREWVLDVIKSTFSKSDITIYVVKLTN